MHEAQASSDRFETSVGKFRILADLGHGGMASVFLAVAKGRANVNKLVVLKVISPVLADDPGSLEAFLEEARLAARLNHPHVVQTYEVGQQGERDVIVMEYLEGQSLYNVLARARSLGKPEANLPLTMHLQIIADALQGLHYAHELVDFDGTSLRLVHRDVSPHNILITFDGVTKLLDFGIAKAAISSVNTEDGIIKGKVAYMSPEQAVGEPIDRRTDIYAMGAVLWEAAAGTRLWKNISDVGILQRVTNGEIPSPRTVNPDVDPELERITMKALSPRPEDRYETADALSTDLEAFMKKLGANETPRSIGRFLSELFKESRARMKMKIERELGRSEAGGDSDSLLIRDAGQMRESGHMRAGDPSSVSTTRTYVGQAEGLIPTATRTRKARSMVAVVAAIALLTVVGVLASRMPGRTTSSARAGTSAVGAASPSAASAREPLPVGARGAASSTAATAPSASASASASAPLAVASPPPRPVAKPASARPAAASPSPPSAAAKPNCDQPLFVDARGIKTLRPECR